MFCKATLFTVALVLLAAASPAERQARGITIPLSKRSSLTRADGTFNFEKAILQTVATRNKHRQNLINLKNNLGEEAFNEGAEIKPLAVAPKSVLRRQNEPLTGEDDDTQWAGTISIGTPAQNLVAVFDTGSSDLWVTSSSCTSSSCSSKLKYNPSSSSTSAKQSGLFNITYGDGSSVAGPIYTDTVTVAGVKAAGQVFSPATVLSAQFKNQSIDGILGLGFPELANLDGTPFFFTAFNQGAVPANEFSFKLASNGSSLVLGGADSSLFTGEMEFHGVSSTGGGFWQISGASAFVGSKTAGSNFQTIIDSGTTLMYALPSEVQTFYKSVSGSSLFQSTEGLFLYSFPCSSVPSVSFSWGGGKKWAISASNFNVGTTKAGSSQCIGALSGLDLGIGSGRWLIGDSFMKNVYTTFSVAQNAVGFATLA